MPQFLEFDVSKSEETRLQAKCFPDFSEGNATNFHLKSKLQHFIGQASEKDACQVRFEYVSRQY